MMSNFDEMKLFYDFHKNEWELAGLIILNISSDLLSVL